MIIFINEKYTKPWNKQAQILISFLLGIVSHSVSDIIWHDLTIADKTRQGYIQALANSDFNAQGHTYNYNVHNEADTGGEFVSAYEIDLSFIKSKWILPAGDLSEIYRRMGFTQINNFVLEICNAELYLEIQAIANLPSELLFPYYAQQSPFMVDEFQDWWFGGINDMAMWSSNCWTNTITQIETNSSKNLCFMSSDNFTYCDKKKLKVFYPKFI